MPQGIGTVLIVKETNSCFKHKILLMIYITILTVMNTLGQINQKTPF